MTFCSLAISDILSMARPHFQAFAQCVTNEDHRINKFESPHKARFILEEPTPKIMLYIRRMNEDAMFFL